MSKRSNQDRISALPDCMLLHILSFLDMKEMVRSSVLSKRWRNTWTYTPILTFQQAYPRFNKYKFVEWVNKTLKTLPSCTSIEKLKVEFHYSSGLAGDFDDWARFASERKAKDVILSFRASAGGLYSVPEFLLCSSSIINLSLQGCKVVPTGDISWTSLRSLSITGSELEDDTIAKILSKSSMLEDLKLSATKGLHHLCIDSQSLRRLVIQLNPGEADKSLKISAPRLQVLCFSSSLRTTSPLVHAPSLVRAEVNLLALSPVRANVNRRRRSIQRALVRVNKDEHSAIAQLFRSFCQVKELELNRWSVEALILLEAKGLLSPFSSLTCLKLNDADLDNMPGIISLLICSRNVEKLVFTKTWSGPKPPSNSIFSEQLEKYWNWSTSRGWHQRSPPHLKTAIFIGFTDQKKVVRFTQQLVKVILGELP